MNEKRTDRLARVLLAGTHSSVGKTTVTVGLLAALRRLGVSVAPFKAGPDYIDPTLHALAAGRPSRNLDAWLLPEQALLGVLRRGMRDAGLAVIEGVMGLFDGIGSSQTGSTAAVARVLDCPVVLVLDVAGMSTTAAALVLGCQRMQPGVRLAGVILNRVGSDGHAASTAEAILAATGLRTLGSLPSDASLAVPERHLGLVPAMEGGMPEATLERLAEVVLRRFDLAAIRALADAAPALAAVDVSGSRATTVGDLRTGVGEVIDSDPRGTVSGEVGEDDRGSAAGGRGVRIAVASDRAFGFYYADTFDLLAERGAEVVAFSPLDDERLPPETDGAYLGGGFPELYAAEIARNVGMRQALHELAARGAPIYAECGGLMALGDTLVAFDSNRFPAFGLLPLTSRMTRDQLTIGYREVEALRDSVLLKRGERVRGHEFHWSIADAPPPALAAYRVLPDGPSEGFVRGAVLGSYVHLSFAASAAPLARFVRLAARAGESRSAATGYTYDGLNRCR